MYTKLLAGVGLATVLAVMLLPPLVAQVYAQKAIAVKVVTNAANVPKAFDPDPVTANVGDNVTWTNTDSQLHTITSGKGVNDANKGKDFDSQYTMLPGKSFSHVFSTAGTFPYFCSLHPQMVGTVQVGQATTPEFPVGVVLAITAAVFGAAILATRWNKLNIPGA